MNAQHVSFRSVVSGLAVTSDHYKGPPFCVLRTAAHFCRPPFLSFISSLASAFGSVMLGFRFG
jgi:hypothetical protein